MPSSVRRDQPDLNVAPDVAYPERLFVACEVSADHAPTRRLAPPSSSRRGPARRTTPGVALAATALLAPFAPALADEARETREAHEAHEVAEAHEAHEVAVEIGYTWTGRDLSTVPTGEDSDALATEYFLVLAPDPDSGLPNLGGHCVALGTANETSGEYTESGDCVLRDVDGDALYEHFTGAGPGGGAPVRGKSTITGGTGKFTGVSGELGYEARFHASPIEGTYQGSGVKMGTLHRPGS